MQTTPNLGMVIPSGDADPFDEMAYSNALVKVDTAWGPSGPGALSKLWDTTDAGVVFPAASVTTPALPGTYKHLRIIFTARSDAVANFENLNLRFNGDSGANYDSQWLQGAGTAVSAGGVLGGTAASLGGLPAGSSPANYFGSGAIDIAAYRDTTAFKSGVGASSFKYDATASGFFFISYSAAWKSAAAISTITFLPGAGNFIAGTRITVYGVA